MMPATGYDLLLPRQETYNPVREVLPTDLRLGNVRLQLKQASKLHLQSVSAEISARIVLIHSVKKKVSEYIYPYCRFYPVVQAGCRPCH